MPIVDSQDSPLDEAMSERLSQRFISEDGLYLDTSLEMTPHLLISVDHMLDWFNHMEEIAGQPLGRRLAHASAESEEWRWNLLPPMPKSWLGQQKKRIANVNSDWAIRGMGQLQMIETSTNGATLLVANRGQTALAAGMANAVWECIEGQRFRFQWSDRGAGETVVECTRDSRQIPPPKESITPWTDVEGEFVDDERLYDRARHEADGLWTVEGNRAIILPRDLLLRFEAMAMAYLSATPRSTDSRTKWDGISEPEQIVLWDAMAEAARRQFLASGELVLIASTEHWISVSRRHLALQGLGYVSNAEEIDEYGGVQLRVSAALHPAIVVGRLIGCWERAEGRSAKATWSSDETGHRIRLESRREIA